MVRGLPCRQWQRLAGALARQEGWRLGSGGGFQAFGSVRKAGVSAVTEAGRWLEVQEGWHIDGCTQVVVRGKKAGIFVVAVAFGLSEVVGMLACGV